MDHQPQRPSRDSYIDLDESDSSKNKHPPPLLSKRKTREQTTKAISKSRQPPTPKQTGMKYLQIPPRNRNIKPLRTPHQRKMRGSTMRTPLVARPISRPQTPAVERSLSRWEETCSSWTNHSSVT